MSIWEGLRNRVRSILDQPEEPTETATIKADRFDRKRWDKIRELPSIDSYVELTANDHDYVEDLVGDVYNLLVKAIPEMPETGEMALTHRPHHAVVSDMREDVATKQLRTMTVNDEYVAAMGLVSTQDKLTSAFGRLKEAQERAKEAQAKQEQARQAAEDAWQAIEAAEDMAALEDEGADEAGELAESMAQQAESLADLAGQASQDAEQAAAGAASAARDEMRQAMTQAYEDAQKEDDLMRGFGVSPGELKRMDFQERANLAKRLSRSRLAKFTDMLGQFRTLQAAESRRRVKHIPDEVTDVILGNDLHRMLPVEMLNLATPEMEDEFWLRYVNGELLSYELSGREKQGKGPIIVVCDESYSMNGEREAWSKALSLALCHQAKQNSRDFHYIGFSDGTSQHLVTMLGGEAPLASVLKMTEHFFGGGTHYEKPLRMAANLVLEAHAQGRPKPDIVFITDDDCRISQPGFLQFWRETKAKTDMQCYGIALAARQSGTLAKLADNVRTLKDLTAHDVTDLFRTI